MAKKTGTPKKFTFTLLAAFLAFFSLVTFLRWHQNNQENFIQEMRSRIKEELRSELTPNIEKLVKAEVQRVYEADMAKLASFEEFNLSKSGSEDISTETLEEAVRRVVQEVYQENAKARTAYNAKVKIASDKLLDEHVAGVGIEPDTTIKGGIVKRPQLNSDFQLAQVDTSKKSESQNYEDSDGAPRPQSIERTMQQKGSVLLPKGQLVVEPSFTYAHFSTNRINIQGITILEVFTIGPVSTEKIQRDMFIQTTSLKYGLANNLQGELRIPARYEFDRISSTDGTSEDTRSKGGIGDVDFSVSRQIGWEEGWRPDLIASFGVKTISGEPIYNNSIGLGTGHWSVRSTLIASKSSDPAVVFGSLSYVHNFERSFDNFGDVQPGDTIAYSLGVAIALSYQTAINFSFDQSITQKLKRGGQKVVGSFVNSANFKTGLNWAINERSSVDLSVAVGLTSDSPDVTVEIRFPYRF